jgi:hypothetical protein
MRNHEARPTDPRLRLAEYVACDCFDCRLAMSYDDAVRRFCRTLLLSAESAVAS